MRRSRREEEMDFKRIYAEGRKVKVWVEDKEWSKDRIDGNLESNPS